NAGFIGEDFGVGDARAVIDADVDVLPPDAARLAPAIAGDPMPDVLDPAQLFDVQMQHLPRPRPFVADKDGALRQRLEAREVQLRQRARDRGRAHLNDLRDLGPRPPELPQPLDFHHHRRGNRTGRAPGPAGAIMEFIPRRANDPLPRRPIAHAKGAGHRGPAFAGLDSPRAARPTLPRCPGIPVHGTPGGISRKTGYKWIDRYVRHGPAGLEEQSRRPQHSPRQTSDEIVTAILDARRRHPRWGGKKLLALLHRRHPRWDLPGRSTACDILSRHGMVPIKRQRRRIGHPGKPTSQILAPNDMWSADYKGQFRTGDGRYCYPLTVADGFSRYLLGCQALPSTAVDGAKPIFTGCSTST